MYTTNRYKATLLFIGRRDCVHLTHLSAVLAPFWSPPSQDMEQDAKCSAGSVLWDYQSFSMKRPETLLMRAEGVKQNTTFVGQKKQNNGNKSVELKGPAHSGGKVLLLYITFCNLIYC